MQSSHPLSPRPGLTGSANVGPLLAQRTGDRLDDIIRSLDSECDLGLQPRDKTWSPSRKANSRSDKVQGQLKWLFWSSKSAFDELLEDFKKRAPRLRDRDARLELLHSLLKEHTSSPHPSRRPRSQTPSNDTLKSLRSPPCKSRTPFVA